MKCITIKQPHAAAIFAGLKRFETRTWRTTHAGSLGIHVSRRPDEMARALAEKHGLSLDADNGLLVGTVDLVRCWRVEELPLDVRSDPWGDFRDGRWAWLLVNPRTLPTPIAIRGQMGLWTFG